MYNNIVGWTIYTHPCAKWYRLGHLKNINLTRLHYSTMHGFPMWTLRWKYLRLLGCKIEIGLSIGCHIANIVVAIFINLPILGENVTCLLVNLVAALMLQRSVKQYLWRTHEKQNSKFKYKIDCVKIFKLMWIFEFWSQKFWYEFCWNNKFTSKL